MEFLLAGGQAQAAQAAKGLGENKDFAIKPSRVRIPVPLSTHPHTELDFPKPVSPYLGHEGNNRRPSGDGLLCRRFKAAVVLTAGSLTVGEGLDPKVALLQPPLKANVQTSRVAGWVPWGQKLRWSVGCKVVTGDQRPSKGRGGSRTGQRGRSGHSPDSSGSSGETHQPDSPYVPPQLTGLLCSSLHHWRPGGGARGADVPRVRARSC